MKAAMNLWQTTKVLWLFLLLGAMGNAVKAQNVPGCDPLGVSPTVDFQLTYNPVTNTYTAWYIPSDNTLHRLVTGQFTIIAPDGFTTPGANGRDANFQITNINGSWSDFVTDDEYITSVGQTSVPALSGYAVHQVGMAPQGIDVDPDGSGPLTSSNPVTAGQAVPLFSFPGSGCASVLRILVNGEPIQSQLLSKFGFNLNNEIAIQIPRAPFVAAQERYCKNAALSAVTLVLPDVQDDAATVCANASTTSYSNNYFTQVFRNWNAANLPTGTYEVKAADRQWTGFTVSPSSLSANVSIDPVTGAYTVTFPTSGGVAVPGSLTICNTLQDKCQTASDQACVVITWQSTGQVAITNVAPACLVNGTATVSLSATSGFTNYSWSGPGLTSATTNPATAALTAAGTYSYTVTVSNGNSCSATATTSVSVVDCGTDLSIAKTGPSSVTAGQSFSYNVVINNNGPSAANGATVVDPGVANFTATSVTCSGSTGGASCPSPTVASLQSGLTIANLPAGGSLTLVVTGTAGTSGTITNIATISTPPGTTDTNPANNSSTAVTPITAIADLAIVKTGPASVTAGGAVSYNLVITNSGPSAANGATVTDPGVANFTATSVTCSGASNGAACPSPTVASLQSGLTIANLPSGGSLTLVVTGTAGTSGTITNIASITPPASVTDTNPANNSSTAVTPITPVADLAITKTGTATAVVGGTVTYNLVVTNNGPSAANGATVVDPAVANLTVNSVNCAGASNGAICPTVSVANLQSGLTIASFPAGGSLTLVVTGTATGTAMITNVASVMPPAGVTDTNPNNNSSTAVTGVGLPTTDVAIVKTGTTTVNANGSVSYNLVITNNGPADANGATVTDPGVANFTATGVSCSGATGGAACPVPTVASLQSGLTIANLPSGGSLTLVVTGTAGTSGTITNIASITPPASVTDTNPANNSSTAVTPITPVVDLMVLKTGPASVTAGQSFSYNVVIRNNGPSAANGATISDPAVANFTATGVSCSGASNGAVCPSPTVASLQSGLTIASLPAGGSLTLVVTGTAGTSGTIANVASVTPPAGTTETNPGDNSSTAVTPITPVADLAITKTGTATAVVGGAVTYNLVVTNNGPSAANGATVVDPAVANLTVNSVNCAGASNGAICPTVSVASLQSGLTIASFPAGGSLTLVVTGTATGTAMITNVASVMPPAGVTDTNPNNNSSTAVTGVGLPTTDVAIVKTGTTTVNANGSVSYNLVITNNGPADANGATVTDPAVANFTATSVSCSGATGGAVCPSPTVASLQSGLTISALPSGGSLTLVVTGTAGTSGTIVNVASIATPPGVIDSNPANNSSTAVTPITPIADLAITKTGPTTALTGDVITYNLVVINNGPSAANGSVVTDPAVANFTATGVSCSGATGGAACPVPTVASLQSGLTIANLPAGGSLTLVVTGTVGSLTGTITNIASVSPPVGTTDTNPGNNSSTVVTTVTQSCSQSLIVLGTPQCGNGTGTYSVNYISIPGTTIVANAGNTSSPGVISGIPAGIALSVTATNGICSQVASANSPVGCTPVVDLAIVKTGTSSVNANGSVSYNLVITNNGPSAANGSVVTDPAVANFTATSVNCSGTTGGAICPAPTVASLQSGLTIATLPSGGSLTLVVTGMAGTSGTIVNVASVATPTGVTDSNPANNSSTAVTPITAIADLAIVKTGPASVTAGGAVSYNLVITNSGPSAANGATVTDPGVANFTATSVTCSGASNGAACPSPTVASLQSGLTIANLPSGGSLTLVVTGTAGTSGTITNIASITPPASVTDTNPANNSSTAVTPITPVADLAITKTGTATTVVGGTVTYNLVVTNNGPSAANGTTVVDPAVTNLTVNSVSCSGASNGAVCPAPTVASLQSGLTISTLPSGGSLTLVVTGVATATGTITNIASVTPPASVTDTNPSNNSATAVTGVGTPVADLAIVKTGPASVNASGAVTYNLVITNSGPADANGATVTDPAVANFTATSVSCAGATGSASCPVNPTVAGLQSGLVIPVLGSGSSVTLVVTGTAGTSGTITNIASITPPASVTDTNPANNSSTVVTPITPVADLAITKTGTATAVVGGTVTYNLVVTNNGPSDANGATVVDPAVANLTVNNVSCVGASNGAVCPAPTVASLQSGLTIASLPAGGSLTLVVTGVATAAGNIVNVASVTPPASVTDTNPANNSATAVTGVGTPVADLAIVKTGTTSVNSNGTVTYNLVITNNGPMAANGATVTDPAVANFTATSVSCSGASNGAVCPSPTVASLQSGLTIANLPAGGSLTLVVTGTAGTSGTIVNVASVTLPTGVMDSNPANNSSTAVTPITSVADLAIVKTGPASVNAGGTVSYNLVITNSGPSAANGATVVDPGVANFTATNVICQGATGGASCPTPTVASLQSGLTIANLPSGGSLTLVVTGTAGASGTIVNIASITPPASVTDTNPANNSSTAVTPIGSVADLAIVKTGPTSTNAAGVVSYNLVITNNGPSAANGATVTDPGVANFTATGVSCVGATGSASCPVNPTVASLQSGLPIPVLGSGSSLTLVVTGTAGTSGTITNVASITPPASVTDTNPANNSSTAVTPITPVADLAITKTGTATAVVGGTVTYNLVVTNNGPSAANGATVVDPAVANLTVNSVNCAGASNGAICPTVTVASLQSGLTIASFPAGGSLTLVVTGTAAGNIVNVASVTPPTGTTDTNPANNSATAVTGVGTPVADVAIVKTGPASVASNGSLSYNLVIVNNGPMAANGSVVTDPAVANFTATSVNCSGATGGAACPVPTVASLQSGLTIANLPTGGSLTLVVTGTAGTSGTIVNVASVALPTGVMDSNPANNSSTAVTPITSVADLAIVKTGPASVNAGGTVSYNLVITNSGPSAANGATVTDPGVANFTATNVICQGATGGASCPTPTVASLQSGLTIANLPSGGSLTLVVTGTAGTSGMITNIASITPPASVTDTNPGNNSSTAVTPITPVADLAITKTGTATAVVGGTVTYNLVVTNNGPSAANGATVVDPAVANFTASNVSCAGASNGAVCPAPTVASLQSGLTIASFPAGGSLTLVVTGTATAAGTIVNIASVTPPVGTTDTSPGNNSSTAITTVTPACQPPVLTVSSPVCNTVTGGTYTVSFFSSGTVTVTGGTINGNTITANSSAANLIVNASNGSCVTSTTVLAPTSCPPPGSCTLTPTLTVGQPICLGNGTYQVSVQAQNGTVATSAGVLSGNTITAQIGTNLIVSIIGTTGCGSYSVAVTSPAPCSTTECTTVALVSLSGPACSSTNFYSVYYTARPGVAVTASAGTVNAGVISNIPVGTTLSVTATSGNCPTQVVSIPSPVNCNPPCTTPLGINIVVTTAECGLSNGELTATVQGGTGQYTYLWSNGGTTATITGLASGLYSVTVTDANGCSGVKSNILLPSTQAPTLALVSVAPASCGQSTGTASVSASSGKAPYTYQWSTGASTSAVSGLPAGQYLVTVYDANGCSGMLTVNVPGSTQIVLKSAASPALCGVNNGVASVTATGGTTPYTYLWNNGATTSSVSGLAAGLYTVLVTDAGGCSATASVSVGNVSGPQVAVSKTDATCNGSASGSSSVTATGGAAPYTYQWSNGATTSNVSGLIAGQYIVTVTDANGCQVTGQVTIGQPDAILAVYSATKISCPSTVANVNQVSISGGTAPYTYQWNNGATTASLTGVAAGNYSVVITDAKGCQAIGYVTVKSVICNTCQPPVLTVSSPVCNTVAGGTYTVTFTSSDPVTVVGGTIAGNVITANSVSGNIVVTSTASAGCTTSLTVLAPASCPTPGNCPLPPVLTVGQPACQGTGNYVVSVSGQNGTISTSAGTLAGNTITVPIGTNIIVSIAGASGCGSYSVAVNSPASCTSACTSAPLVTLSGPSCSGNGFYSVAYTAIPGVTVTASAGTVSAGMIDNIPLGSPVSVTASNGTCPNQVVTLQSPVNCSLADLAIVKTGPATANSGSTISYNLVIRNNGPSAANGATVVDPVVANFTATNVICAGASNGAVCPSPTVASLQSGLTIASLPAGGSLTLVVTGTAGASGTIVNIASVTPPASVTDTNPANNSSTAVTPITPVANLAIVKTGPASANAGSTVSYNLVITNSGPSAANGATVTDPAVANFTATNVNCLGATGIAACPVNPTVAGLQSGLVIPTLGSGSSLTLVVTGTAGASGTIVNIASITPPASVTDTNPGDNSSTAVTPISSVADLAITKTGTTTTTVGGAVSYNLVITNNGPSVANGAVVTDPAVANFAVSNVSCAGASNGAVCPNPTVASLQSGLTIATLPSGSSLTLVVTGTATATGSIINIASVTPPASVTDTNPLNNSATAVTGVGTPVADLAIVKTGPASVTAGGAVSYNLVIRNNGPSAANGATVTDPAVANFTATSASCAGASGDASCPTVTVSSLQSGLAIASLPAGSSLTLVVTGMAGSSGTIVNVASINPPVGTTDTNPGNNSSTAVTPITPVTSIADLAIVKTGPASVNGGGSLSYNLVITNNGPSAANGATVIDPAVANFTATNVSCQGASGGAACPTVSVASLQSGLTIAMLPSGGSLTLVVTGTASASGTIVNVASITPPASVTDTNPANNSSTAVTPITPVCQPPLLTVSSAVCSTVAGGTYTAQVLANSGTILGVVGGSLNGNILTANTATGTMVVTSSNGAGCSTSLTVVAPASCTVCADVAVVKVGQPVCLGNGSYAVSVTGQNGTVTTSAGTLVGNVLTVPVGTNVIVSITGSCNSNSVVVASPVNCNTTTCDGSPLVSLSGPECESNGTYRVNYTAKAGVTVTANAGLVSNGIISQIPLGMVLSVSATNGTCPPQSATMASPTNCPFCSSPLGINIVVTTAGCSLANGELTATVKGGTGSYTYKWSNGGTTATITGLSSGLYSVTVTDGNGCSGVQSNIFLPSTQAPTVALASVGAANCGQATGTASVSVSGGTAPYTYQWSTGASTSSVSGLTAGQYQVTVYDANGCSAMLTVNVPGSTQLALTTSASPALCGVNNGVASVTTTGGTTPYGYKWSNGATTATISGLASGLYSVTATDAGGCSATATVNVGNASGPQVTVSKTDVSCNGAATGTASVNVNGGTVPYTYLWSTGATTSSVSGLSAGQYLVTVTDANGCRVSSQVSVTQPAAILAVYSPAKIICPSTVANINQVSISGGTAPYTYKWSNGATTASLTGVMAGSYTVVITDANGCQAIGMATIQPVSCNNCQPPLLTVSSAQCSTVAGGTYTATFTSSDPVTVIGGTIVGNVITANSLTTNLIVTAQAAAGCTTSQTVVAPATCPGPQCTLKPVLYVGQPACQGTGNYVVSVSGENGTISTSAGTLVGKTLTVPVGTNVVVTITGGTGCGSYSVAVASPASCTSACTGSPLASISGPICSGNSFYSVNYTAPSGVTVTASAGVVSAGIISQIPVGTPVSITVTNGVCTQTETIASPVSCVTSTDLAIVKTGPANVNSGGTVSYNLVITNNGPAAANGAVVTDPAVADFTATSASCAGASNGANCPTVTVASLQSGLAIASLPSGGSLTLVVTGTAGTSGTIVNVASITPPAGTTDTNPGDNSSTAVTPITPVTPSVDLVITKTGTATAVVGGAVTYNLVIRNNGPSAANGAVVTDPTVANFSVSGVTCSGATGGAACPTSPTVAGLQSGLTIASLPSGGSLTLVVTGTASATGNIINIARVTPPVGTTETNPGNNSSTAVTTVTNPCSQSLVVFNTPQCNAANGTYSVNYVIVPGTQLVANAGNTSNLGVITDIPVATILSVTATNGLCVQTKTVYPPAGCGLQADLAVVKTGPASVTAGGAVSYKLVVTNTGPAAANGAVVTDPAVANFSATSVSCSGASNGAVCPSPTVASLQSGLTIATLPSGGSLTLVVTGTAGASGTIVNVASINPPTGVVDTNPANNSSTAVTPITPVTPMVNLAIVKTGPVSVTAGGTVSYKLTITNNGPSAANGATVVDPAVANFTATSVSCAGTTGGASCPSPTVASLQSGLTISTLPSGGSLTLVVTGTAGASGTIVNVATVTPPAGTTETNPGDNSSTAVTPITPATPVADLAIVKTGPASVDAGGSLSYKLVITNNGPAAANGAVVTDPAVTNFTATGASCAGANNGATCPAVTVASLQSGLTIATLPSGGSLTLVVTGTAGASGTIVNVATVTPPTGTTDTNPGNNSSTAVTPITKVCVAPMLTLCNPACNTATGGFTFTYLTNGTDVTVSNGATVNTATHTVSVPAGVTAVVVSVKNADADCSNVTSITIAAPTGCNPPVCVTPTLFVCQPVCNGDGTYSVGYLVSPGASVTANAGVFSAGNKITVPVGTQLIVTASNGPNCSASITINSPISCSACNQPTFGVSGIVCRNNGTSYDVQYITNSSSATVTASAGVVSGSAVTGIPSGQSVVLTLLSANCPPASITVAAPTSCTPTGSCVTLELKVLLEGPYNTSTHLMNTTLNSRGLLPGQTPIGMFAVSTPAGQPYNTAPWNYTGTESITNYPTDVVDWVLVSLRTDSLTTNTVFRAAGLLHSDGRITFVTPCFNIPDGKYFPVIEHRNHMGVMSPYRVPVVNNKLIFDFTTQDSYTITDPPSFGEIKIDNRWMMYGGDGKKDTYTDDFDINFFDSKLWKDESGIFDQYRYGDFNMDADVNFSDSVLWNKNNGRYSKVPH